MSEGTGPNGLQWLTDLIWTDKGQEFSLVFQPNNLLYSLSGLYCYFPIAVGFMAKTNH